MARFHDWGWGLKWGVGASQASSMCNSMDVGLHFGLLFASAAIYVYQREDQVFTLTFTMFEMPLRYLSG